MDGVHPPRCALLWNGCDTCCASPLQSSGAALALLIPPQYSSVLRLVSRTVSLPGAWCAVVRVSVVFVRWGILCPLPPLSWWWVGALRMVGAVRWCGMVLKGGGCDGAPPVRVLVSPFRSRGGRVEGRVRCVL